MTTSKKVCCKDLNFNGILMHFFPIFQKVKLHKCFMLKPVDQALLRHLLLLFLHTSLLLVVVPLNFCGQMMDQISSFSFLNFFLLLILILHWKMNPTIALHVDDYDVPTINVFKINFLLQILMPLQLILKHHLMPLIMIFLLVILVQNLDFLILMSLNNVNKGSHKAIKHTKL